MEVTLTKTVLENGDFQGIVDLAHDTEQFLFVGDEISFKLKDGTPVTFVVAHFNPYGEGVALVLKDCLPDRHAMNDSWTNAGGWRDSEMRKYLNSEIYELLPDDVKAAIKERTIIQKHKGKTYESKDKLWLLSRTELEGEYSTDVDDVHFDLFKDERSRVKQIDDETWWYWTRSPVAGGSGYFVYVYTGGSSTGNGSANNSNGVAFGFLI